MATKTFLILIVIIAIIAVAGPQNILADQYDKGHEKSWYHKIFDRDDDDDDDRKHRKRYRRRNRDDNHHESYLKPVNNPTYKENCGVCHFAYQPELLPSSSWKNILGRLEDHFGDSFELEPDAQKIISSYIETNAAEHSTAKRAVKIMRSLGSRTPMRITEIPYIREKHHEISASVLSRESIGSLSNCSACHKRAEEGIYDDDFVSIPK
jgi:hypothetical protein